MNFRLFSMWRGFRERGYHPAIVLLFSARLAHMPQAALFRPNLHRGSSSSIDCHFFFYSICLRKAQYEGRPGDILTLADDAPTRLHRTKILYEAAVALINMCRYPAAEKVLREIINTEPDSPKAQFQLARALSPQNRTEEAEHTLRTILQQHEDDPHAGDLLGQVFRQLWHLAWTKAG